MIKKILTKTVTHVRWESQKKSWPVEREQDDESWWELLRSPLLNFKNDTGLLTVDSNGGTSTWCAAFCTQLMSNCLKHLLVFYEVSFLLKEGRIDLLSLLYTVYCDIFFSSSSWGFFDITFFSQFLIGFHFQGRDHVKVEFWQGLHNMIVSRYMGHNTIQISCKWILKYIAILIFSTALVTIS